MVGITRLLGSQRGEPPEGIRRVFEHGWPRRTAPSHPLSIIDTSLLPLVSGRPTVTYTHTHNTQPFTCSLARGQPEGTEIDKMGAEMGGRGLKSTRWGRAL